MAGSVPHLVLVDGSGFIFRAYHALPPMSRADGVPVNAVYGFTNMLGRLLQEHTGTHIAVVFDASRTTFRNDLYPLYKAQRPEPPEDLTPQFALVRDAVVAFGVPSIELVNWEADDLIASYATAASREGWRTTIVSSDKDLMQLVDGLVTMQDPIKQRAIGPGEVMEKFGVPPNQVVEVQALMGDSVDNVPGVPGIGPKGAALLIQEYGTVEAVLAAAADVSGGMKASKRRDMLVEHAEAARISRRLVELSCDVPLPVPLAGLVARDPDVGVLTAWFDRMGFKSVAGRLGFSGAARPVEAEAAAPLAADAAGYGPYECVTTVERLQAWVTEATAGGIVALDTEVDGIDALRGVLVGVSLVTSPGRGCYVPLGHAGLDVVPGAPTLEAPEPGVGLPMLGVVDAMGVLAPMLGNGAVLKVMHNAKFHMLVLDRAGVSDVGPIDDVMLISYAPGAGAHGHGIGEIGLRALGHTAAVMDGVTGAGRARVAFSMVPLAAATGYAPQDADVALRAWGVLRPALRGAQSLAIYEQQERRLVPILMRMEQAGVRVDEGELRRMSADFARRMEGMEMEIHAMVGHPFNVGSPKVLGEILFDEMKLPGGRRTAAGAWGTDVVVLQTLAEQGHELPARVIDWRQLSKLRSTYTEALAEAINPETGRVHTTFAQAVASTGRLSSTEPNLQNIPIRTEEGAAIRRAFVSSPGHVLVSCDYSQIELRLMAHVADIGPLKEAFATGQDIHARTASEVFGVPMEGMEAGTRRRAKAINFGIIYGISAFGLARQLQIEPGEAKVYIDAYFARYPGIRAYMDRAKEEARQFGYVLTPFGRRCFVPGIKDKMPQKRAYAERQAINAPLQGGAADIIKKAMVRLPAAMDAAELRARLLLSVHDELLFEAPDGEEDEVARVAKRVMEGAAVISVPLVVETGTGVTWAAAH